MTRRKNLNPEEVAKMKDLDDQAISRIEIARRFECTPACVTRKLGAKRSYNRQRPQDAEPTMDSCAVKTEAA